MGSPFMHAYFGKVSDAYLDGHVSYVPGMWYCY